MILIADSGSTKTDWCVVKNGKVKTRVKTIGMNPFFQTEEEMTQLLKEHLLPGLKLNLLEKVYFYGAGCIPEKASSVRRVLESVLGVSAEVESDLLGAARALCGRQPGIACILGTGSNSCFYDGEKIVNNIPSLGFILGDEGSGANLGRRLLREYLRGALSPKCEKDFYKQFKITKEEALDKVYKQPFANRFLASLAPFLLSYLNKDSEEHLCFFVKDSFLEFFMFCVEHYDCNTYKVHMVGSVAWYFSDPIKDVAYSEGITLGTISQSPMEGLIDFHTKN